MAREGDIVSAVRHSATFLGGTRHDHDLLIEMARDARVVLLGEPTHGSHEVYRERARISQRLVDELGFRAIVWEADWPDADRVGKYVRDGMGADSPEQALDGFARFPTWMWRNTAAYYRSMFGSRIASWNLRDRHMAETLESLLAFLGPDSRVVVWAHNSHLGDARATEMGDEGELNVGQLVRERFGNAALLVGFTTYDGTVTAAHEWDGPAERMQIVPSMAGSVESIFHDVGLPRFFLPLRDPGEALGALREPRLERAIGVIYRPGTERASHYFSVRVADQFDAIVHLDRTRAVEPLDRVERWTPLEPPESFPTGM